MGNTGNPSPAGAGSIQPAPNGPLATNGYAWWYVDAVSPDGALGITAIAMVGSVFSPYYAKARRKGPVDPLRYPAFNVGVYGPNGMTRWAMSEYGPDSVDRSSSHISIGPNRMWWEPGRLRVEFTEKAVPWGGPIRGTIDLEWKGPMATESCLDPAGKHLWTPIAPSARVRVELTEPSMRFDGFGYHDANRGSEPLEACFESWTWSRISTPERTGVAYDVRLVDGSWHDRGWVFQPGGPHQTWEPSRRAQLGQTGWRMGRAARGESSLELLRTLEDTPFYARSLVKGTLLDDPAIGVHESLSLRRFTSRWVQTLLPWKIRRH